MSLTEKPAIVHWPDTHYVFLEKIGPFQETAPLAWKDMHSLIPELSVHSQVTQYMALYKSEANKMTYRAGVGVASKPKDLAKPLEYEYFHGGKYTCFILKGSYSQLPEACGRACEIVNEMKIKTRNDFYIEYYTNNPRITPEEELVTEILIPILW